MNLFQLWNLKRYLKGFHKHLNVVAHRDPTMLFSALMWGNDLARRQGLLEAFWPLKVALFQAGDRIVESVVATHGLAAFKEHFVASESSEEFYVFSDDLLSGTNSQDDFDHMQKGYRECEAILQKKFSSQAHLVRRDWIKATNLALRSVFWLEDWDRALREGSVEKLLDLVEKEESDKNVKVVCQILSVSRHFNVCLPYPGQEKRIVEVCSRWFTLLDDFLDLKYDTQNKQPNHLVAKLAQYGELDSWLKTLDANSEQFEKKCPQTAKWYFEAFAQARENFIEAFPVWPRFFVKKIEKAARENKQSPF